MSERILGQYANNRGLALARYNPYIGSWVDLNDTKKVLITLGRRISPSVNGGRSGCQKLLKVPMAELDEIYNTKLIELAGASTRGARLEAPDATATAHSKLCGSTVTVDLKVANGKVSDYGQTVKACLLGQAAAAVVAREIVGSTPEELHVIAAQMRAMLKENGPPPTGRWADLASLEPVRNYRARHASTLLVFDAIERALDEVGAKSTATAKAL